MSAARHAGAAHVSLGGREGYDRAEAAVRTLERLGYTHRGGREWAPPLGEAPCTPESHAKPRMVRLADENDRFSESCPACRSDADLSYCYFGDLAGSVTCAACGWSSKNGASSGLTK